MTIARSGLLAVTLSAVLASPALADSQSGESGGNPANLAATAAAALSSSGSADASSCSTPQLSQPFVSYGDSNWYTLAPGETADNFGGTGWTLIGGANLATTQLADGQTGSVLDLPSGAVAISPPMCVDSNYPTARTMVQTTNARVLAGVFYASAPAGSQLQFSGMIQSQGSGFSLSRTLRVHPDNVAGWQMVRFIFGATGIGGDGQIYNFYVDPRMN